MTFAIEGISIRSRDERPLLLIAGAWEDERPFQGLLAHVDWFLAGMVHGLAGSAGLMIVMIPTIDSNTVGILYILVFGLGSVGGMMLMSLLVGLPFHLTAARFNRFNNLLQGVAGAVSVVFGLLIIYEKGITEGLLV